MGNFKIHSNLMYGFRINLKTFLGLAMPKQCCQTVVLELWGWFLGDIVGQKPLNHLHNIQYYHYVSCIFMERLVLPGFVLILRPHVLSSIIIPYFWNLLLPYLCTIRYWVCAKNIFREFCGLLLSNTDSCSQSYGY